MSRTTRTAIAAAIAAALLTGLLVGTLSMASADDAGDTRATATIYKRTIVEPCNLEFCTPDPPIVRCKAGDYATGGAAWLTTQPNGAHRFLANRPWLKKGNPRGWRADLSDPVTSGHTIYVQVVCISP